MNIPNNMEQMIFSFGYYEVLNFDKVKEFLTKLEEKEIFVIDEIDIGKKEILGTFIRDYPKNHWNPVSKTPGAKQIVGSVKIKDGILKIDTKAKSALQELMDIFESRLQDSIKFQKVEYEDILAKFRK